MNDNIPEEMQGPDDLMYHISRLMKPGGKVILKDKDGSTILDADDLKRQTTANNNLLPKAFGPPVNSSNSPKSRQERRRQERENNKGLKESLKRLGGF